MLDGVATNLLEDGGDVGDRGEWLWRGRGEFDGGVADAGDGGEDYRRAGGALEKPREGGGPEREHGDGGGCAGRRSEKSKVRDAAPA